MTPVGWAEELSLQEAGFDAAVAVMQKKQKSRQRTPDLPQEGQPVYGMPGTRFVPGRGIE